jgi:nicotinic acid mononucleotide adenylyltransferase
MPAVSSTEVRARLASGDSVAGMLPTQVESYLRKHALYAV